MSPIKTLTKLLHENSKGPKSDQVNPKKFKAEETPILKKYNKF